MAFRYRRRNVRPRRPARMAKRRYTRGKRVFVRKGRLPSKAIHIFRRQYAATSILEGAAAQNLVYNFNPTTDFPGLAEYQTLYDQIKIHSIQWTFEPIFNPTNASGVAPQQRWVRYVHDFDDATPLTTQQQYFDYANCQSRNIVSPRPFSIKLYPLMQMSGIGGVGANLKRAGWLDIDAAMPTFNSIKMFVPLTGVTVGSGICVVRVSVTFSCRSTK